MMTAHVVSYAIFIFALFLYFLSLSGIGDRAATSTLTDLVAIFAVLSQGILMLIFFAITNQAKDSRIKSQTLLHEDIKLQSSFESEESFDENLTIESNQGGNRIFAVGHPDKMILRCVLELSYKKTPRTSCDL